VGALVTIEHQLALGLGLRDDSTFDTFYPGKNQQIIAHLKEMIKPDGEQFIYLWGTKGVGCTHLLQGACHWAQAMGSSSVYYSLLSDDAKISMLQGLEKLDLVCIDDVQAVSGNSNWEEALFHAYNRFKSSNTRLLIAGHHPPQKLGVELADLRSRLMWGVTYQVHALDDAELLRALQLRAKQRGLVLPAEVGDFIIRRCPRSMPVLYHILDTLDDASLVARRKLTIPFVKQILSV
jgi:DnaA family protein